MEKLKQTLKQAASLLPTRLPVGVTEFEAWANSIIELVGPLADDDSIKFTLASMIMHLGPQRSSVPKNYFVRSLRKTAANQIAHSVLTAIKQKHDEAAKAAKQAEDTAKLNASKAESASEENQKAAQ